MRELAVEVVSKAYPAGGGYTVVQHEVRVPDEKRGGTLTKCGFVDLPSAVIRARDEARGRGHLTFYVNGEMRQV